MSDRTIIVHKDGSETIVTHKPRRSAYNPRNPNNEPTGHYTGRCKHCGSNNLWDDNLAYGCRDCGALLCSSNS